MRRSPRPLQCVKRHPQMQNLNSTALTAAFSISIPKPRKPKQGLWGWQFNDKFLRKDRSFKIKTRSPKRSGIDPLSAWGLPQNRVLLLQALVLNTPWHEVTKQLVLLQVGPQEPVKNGFGSFVVQGFKALGTCDFLEISILHGASSPSLR